MASDLMVQQTIDSNFSEYGLGTGETNLSTRDKQIPVAAKKTVLRDVQNENRIASSIGNSPLSKDRAQTVDSIKVSGTKRHSAESPVSPPHHHSPCSNAPNAQLVYVRRKCEVEAGKSSTCSGRTTNADCLSSRQLGYPEETAQQTLQLNEPKVPCFQAIATIPAASLISASGKLSVPLPPGQSSMRFSSADSDNHPVTSAFPSLTIPKAMKNVHWEDRFRQLKVLLKKMDESDQGDYVQMLRSVSSVELSRHAVELEKRSIQLSLEEAKEVQRVVLLNVLGKSIKNYKAVARQGLLEK